MITHTDFPKRIVEQIVTCSNRLGENLYRDNQAVQLQALQTLGLVNRRWYSAVQPYIDHIAIFQRVDRNADPNSMVIHTSEHIPDYVWSTNIHRFMDTQTTNMVNEVIIHSESGYAHPQEILEYIYKLNIEAYKWDYVTKLRIRQAYVLDDIDNPTYPDDSIEKLSSWISNEFPSVTDVECHDTGNSRLNGENLLSSYFANNIGTLRRIVTLGGNNPDFGVKLFPMHITHLEIECKYSFDPLTIPKIFAPSLRKLKLSCIPISYIWDQFYTKGSETLQFTNLVDLTLSFFIPNKSISPASSEKSAAALAAAALSGTATPRQPKRYSENNTYYTELRSDRRRPEFPKLKRLDIWGCPVKYQHLLEDFPCAQLQELKLGGSKSAFKSINFKQFGQVSDFSITCFRGSKYREMAHLNRLLEKTLKIKTARTLRLDMVGEIPLSFPPTISCSKLSKLVLTAPIYVLDLTRALPLMDSIESIELIHAKFSTVPESESLLDVFANALRGPANGKTCKSLLSLSLSFFEFGSPMPTICANIIPLLVVAPNIDKFKIFPSHGDTIKLLVDWIAGIPEYKGKFSRFRQNSDIFS